MHPELGLQEVRTSNLIADLLTKFGLDVQRNFAGTAVLGTLHTNKPGKTVVLRADMDALPIQDAKDVPTAHKFQVSVMPAAMMPITCKSSWLLRTIFPIIVL